MGFPFHRLHFSPILSSVSLILIGVFISLGIWQLQRAEEKQQRQSEASARLQVAARPVLKLLTSPEIPIYSKAFAEGKWLDQHRIVVENRRHGSRVGVHVISPLQMPDGQILLVNRGWASTEQLNEEANTAPPSFVKIHGRVHQPLPPALVTNEESFLQPNVRQWPYFTIENFQRWSGLKTLPFMLLQSEDDPGPYVRQWPRPQFNDGMHIGYAIQWFAFALIWAAIWLKMSYRKPPQQQESP